MYTHVHTHAHTHTHTKNFPKISKKGKSKCSIFLRIIFLYINRTIMASSLFIIQYLNTLLPYKLGRERHMKNTSSHASWNLLYWKVENWEWLHMTVFVLETDAALRMPAYLYLHTYANTQLCMLIYANNWNNKLYTHFLGIVREKIHWHLSWTTNSKKL